MIPTIELNRHREIGNGLVVLVLGAQGSPTADVGVDQLGIEADRLGQIGDGIVELVPVQRYRGRISSA